MAHRIVVQEFRQPAEDQSTIGFFGAKKSARYECTNIKISGKEKQRTIDAQRWAKDNLWGKFSMWREEVMEGEEIVLKYVFDFPDEADAMMFKLKWQ